MKKAEVKYKVTQEEKELWQESADRLGLTLSEFLRLAANQLANAPTPKQIEQKKAESVPTNQKKEVVKSSSTDSNYDKFLRIKKGLPKMYH